MQINKSRFWLPEIEENAQEGIAKVLLFVVFAFSLVGGIVALLNILLNPLKWPGGVFLLLFACLYLGIRELIRRNRVQVAAYLFSSFQWVLIIVLVTISGGETSPLFNLIFITFLIPGMLLGWKAGAIFAAMSAMPAVGRIYAANNGISLPSLIEFTPTTSSIADFSSVVLASVIFLFATYTTQAELRRSQQFARALSESRSQLSKVVSNSPVALFSIDKEGIFTLSEGKGLEKLGLAPGEVVGKSAYEMYQDVSQIVEDLKKAQAGEEFMTSVEVAGLVFVTSYSPIRNEQGAVVGVIGVSTDITEQKEAERESESLAKFPAENPSPVMRISRDHTVLFANEASRPLREEWGCEVGSVLEGECATIFQEVVDSNELQRIDMDINGQTFNLIFSPVTGTDYVNIYGLDITQRKLAEERTQEQYRRIRALRQIDNAISSSFNRGVVLEVVLEQVITQLRVDAAGVLLANPGTQELKYASHSGFRINKVGEKHGPLSKSLADRVVRERRVVSNFSFPDSDGGELLPSELQDHGFVSYFGAPLITKGNTVGVLEVYHRERINPETDWLDFLETLAGQTAIAIDNAGLVEELQRSNKNLRLAYDATLEGWVHALDLRDRETEDHTQRVTKMTMNLARKIGIRDSDLRHVRRGALLHDIGKMGIPDSILQKRGPLTDKEWEIMRKHPQYAFDFLSPIDYLRPALDIPYGHHEKWDGTGYPQGQKGEQIPLAARIFAVADVWDALTSDRPYRKAWPKKKSLEYIKEQAGMHFDPEVVEAFLEFIEEV